MGIVEFEPRDLVDELGCDDRAEIECDAYCVTEFTDFIGRVDFNQPNPEDPVGRTWGQFLCDKAGDPVQAELEAFVRLCSADDFDWFPLIYDEERLLCCNFG